MKLVLAVLAVVLTVKLSTATGGSHSHSKFGPLDVYSKVGTVNQKSEETEDDTQAAVQAMQSLEFARRYVTSGIWTVPPLDPYKVQDLKPVSLHSKHLNGTLVLNNLQIRGGRSATITDLQVSFGASRIDFDVSIPELVATVHIDGLNLDNGCVQYNISSDVKITLHNYRAAGALSAKAIPQLNVYRLTGLEARTTADSIEYETNNKIGCVNHITKEIIQAISDTLTAVALDNINHMLLGYKSQQVQRLLKAEAAALRSGPHSMQ